MKLELALDQQACQQNLYRIENGLITISTNDHTFWFLPLLN